MRLIDGDELISVFAERKEVWRGNGVLPSNESLMWLAAMGITANSPTVDAAPVVHGRWIPVLNGIDDDTNPAFDCSECDAMCNKKHNYCPSCGAKMDLEEQRCTSTDTEH